MTAWACWLIRRVFPVQVSVHGAASLCRCALCARQGRRVTRVPAAWAGSGPGLYAASGSESCPAQPQPCATGWLRHQCRSKATDIGPWCRARAWAWSGEGAPDHPCPLWGKPWGSSATGPAKPPPGVRLPLAALGREPATWWVTAPRGPAARCAGRAPSTGVPPAPVPCQSIMGQHGAGDSGD